MLKPRTVPGKTIIVLLTVLLCCLLLGSQFSNRAAAAADTASAAAQSTTAEQQGKVVIITMNELSLTELNQYKGQNFERLLAQGIVGLMNINTGGANNSDNAYATIGAGARIEALGFGSNYYDAGETLEDDSAAATEFRRRTGLTIKEQEGFSLSVVKLASDIGKDNYKYSLGALGTALTEAGLTTAVLGNSDYKDIRERQAAAIAVNDSGIVNYSCTADILASDDYFPAGSKTDLNQLKTVYENYLNSADLLVVDLGDIARLNNNQEYYSAEILEQSRQQVWSETDAFLGQVLDSLDLERDLLLFTSPNASPQQIKDRDLLTPFIMAGKDVGSGLAVSPTTKRDGVLCNIDIAATVLDYFQLELPTAVIGKTITAAGTAASLSVEQKLTELLSLEDNLVFIYSNRNTFIKTYVTIQIILLLSSLLFVFYKRLNGKAKYLQPLLLANMTFPLTLLLMTWIPVHNLWLYGFIALIMVIALTFICSAFAHNKEIDPFTIICILTAAVLLLDIFCGQLMIKRSFLGYDPIIGARFYGIGNEYMGVLIGSLLIASAAIVNGFKGSKLSFIMAAAVYLLAIYAIAAPNLGTNVGGTIAAVVGFGVILLLFFDCKISLKNLFILGCAVAAVLVLLMIFDSLRGSSQQSHIGRTVSAIMSGGFAEIWDIISRKMATNIKLIRYSIWSKLFVASLLCLAVFFYAPAGVLKRIKKRYSYLYSGFYALIAGSIAALLFNDSGVVAAATMMIFGASPLIYLVIRERQLLKEEELAMGTAAADLIASKPADGTTEPPPANKEK